MEDSGPEPVPITLGPDPDQNRGFYGVSEALSAKLIGIALANPTTQELIDGHTHQLLFGEQTFIKKTYHLSVGVHLKPGMSMPRSQEPDPSSVERHVGRLSIGYSGRYFLTFDDVPSVLTKIVLEPDLSPGFPPELTTEDMQKALDIAWCDALLQELLEGKTYDVAPDEIGVIHQGANLLGISFSVRFDKAYYFDALLPVYPSEPYHFIGEGNSLYVGVSFDTDLVDNIFIMQRPDPSPPWLVAF